MSPTGSRAEVNANATRLSELRAALQRRSLPAPDGRTWLDIFEAAAHDEGAHLEEVLVGATTRTPTRARRVALAVLASLGYSAREVASVVGCGHLAILAAKRWAATNRPAALLPSAHALDDRGPAGLTTTLGSLGSRAGDPRPGLKLPSTNRPHQAPNGAKE